MPKPEGFDQDSSVDIGFLFRAAFALFMPVVGVAYLFLSARAHLDFEPFLYALFIPLCLYVVLLGGRNWTREDEAENKRHNRMYERTHIDTDLLRMHDRVSGTLFLKKLFEGLASKNSWLYALVGYLLPLVLILVYYMK